MSDQADLNNVLEDINDVSVCLMEARDDFKRLTWITPSESQKDVLSKLNEAMMLVDDAMAVMVDEIGGVFENEA